MLDVRFALWLIYFGSAAFSCVGVFAQESGPASTRNDPAVPRLIKPDPDAVMDNGRTDFKGVIRWVFEWSAVEKAEEYQLEVQHVGSDFKTVDVTTKELKFVKVSKGFLNEKFRLDWGWRVRAKVGGNWGNWSDRRAFTAEPADTDPQREPADEEADTEPEKQGVQPGPALLAPLDDAELDNGRRDRRDSVAWEFSWEPVPEVQEYELEVKRKASNSKSVFLRTKETTYKKVTRGWIIPEYLDGWTWRVRAKVGGEWTSWSTRGFHVEPADTDPPEGGAAP